MTAPIAPAVARKWVPTIYVDEVSPPARATPSDWIVALPGDVSALAPADEDDAPTYLLKVGDVIDFDWTEVYATIGVTFNADGSFTAETPPDPRANCVMIDGDGDTINDSIEAAAKDYADNGYLDEPTTRVEVQQYAWSPRPQSYRFEYGAEGPRFVAVNADAAS